MIQDNYVNKTLNKQTVKNCLVRNKDMYVKSKYISCLKPIQVRESVRELRSEGMFIIADKKGYMYTENDELIIKYIAKRRYELNKEHKILKIMEQKYINKNQIKLFDESEEKKWQE